MCVCVYIYIYIYVYVYIRHDLVRNMQACAFVLIMNLNWEIKAEGRDVALTLRGIAHIDMH